MLSTHLNLFHRRDDGYSAEKYELDMHIYLFDLCKFFFAQCTRSSISSLGHAWLFSILDAFALLLASIPQLNLKFSLSEIFR